MKNEHNEIKCVLTDRFQPTKRMDYRFSEFQTKKFIQFIFNVNQQIFHLTNKHCSNIGIQQPSIVK